MIYAIFFSALFIQALGGFGAGLFAVPLLTIFHEPKFIIPPFALITLLLNILMLFETRASIDREKVGLIVAGSLAGLPFGILALTFADQNIIRLLIALVTFTLGIMFLFGFKPAVRATKKTFAVAGIISGLLSGSAAMGGPPLILLLMALGMKKNMFRATLIGCFVFNGILGNFLYFASGLFSPLNIKIALIGFLPALAGTLLGIRVKNFLPEEKFSRIAVILIILIGITGTIRAVSLFLR